MPGEFDIVSVVGTGFRSHGRHTINSVDVEGLCAKTKHDGELVLEKYLDIEINNRK